ncbi:hypothetical protein [Nocardia sp. NPDC051570]|uniref:hypothetical protein n=1 Tax=Nocardia sp. NPDC051570 TaxID=3364324 RepID=UPI0037AC63BB
MPTWLADRVRTSNGFDCLGPGGPFHAPMVALRIGDVLRDIARQGGVGAGYRVL